jgi:hypothetical protein
VYNTLVLEYLLLGEMCGSSSREVCEHETQLPGAGNAYKYYERLFYAYSPYSEKIKVGL